MSALTSVESSFLNAAIGPNWDPGLVLLYEKTESYVLTWLGLLLK